MERVRAFISIDLDDELILDRVLKVQSLLSSFNCRIRFVGKANIHLTLKFLGEIPLAVVDEILDVMSDSVVLPFEIELKGVGFFPSKSRPRVVWVGVGEGASSVSKIFTLLDQGLRRLGFRSEGKSFVPHMTIGRFKGRCNVMKYRDVLREFEEFSFGSFHVDRIRLKRSVLTSSGPIYSVLGEVMLG